MVFTRVSRGKARAAEVTDTGCNFDSPPRASAPATCDVRKLESRPGCEAIRRPVPTGSCGRASATRGAAPNPRTTRVPIPTPARPCRSTEARRGRPRAPQRRRRRPTPPCRGRSERWAVPDVIRGTEDRTADACTRGPEHEDRRARRVAGLLRGCVVADELEETTARPATAAPRPVRMSAPTANGATSQALAEFTKAFRTPSR
jgi:hypothetical protein